MGPEELVGRAEEDVGVHGADVDRPMRAVVDGVDPGERAGLVRQVDDPAHVRDRPHRVGGPGKATTRVRSPSALQIVQVEVASSSRMSTKRTTRSRSCASSSQGEMFPSWSSRVTRISSPARSSRPSVREREVQRRHVLAEADLVRLAAEKARRDRSRRSARRCARSSRTARRGSRSTPAGRTPSPR